MRSRVFQILLSFGALALSSVAMAEDATSDFAFLEVYTSAWNTHDGNALAALFTDDADLMMGSLPLVSGREAIGEWWQMYFSRIDNEREGTFEIISSRVIAPGVRLVNVNSKTSSANKSGDQLETRLARGTWVVVKKGERWLIAAMRGLPAQGEQRLLPGTDR